MDVWSRFRRKPRQLGTKKQASLKEKEEEKNKTTRQHTAWQKRRVPEAFVRSVVRYVHRPRNRERARSASARPRAKDKNSQKRRGGDTRRSASLPRQRRRAAVLQGTPPKDVPHRVAPHVPVSHPTMPSGRQGAIAIQEAKLAHKIPSSRHPLATTTAATYYPKKHTSGDTCVHDHGKGKPTPTCIACGDNEDGGSVANAKNAVGPYCPRPSNVVGSLRFSVADAVSCKALRTLRAAGVYDWRRISETYGVEVQFPWFAEYNSNRLIANLRFQLLPTGIVCARSTKDVARALHFARSHGLSVSVRSGGHQPAWFSIQNQIVIDTSHLNWVVFEDCDDDNNGVSANDGKQVYIGDSKREPQHRGHHPSKQPQRRQLVRIGVGAHLGKVYAKLAQHDLLLPFGTCASVTASQSLIGGIGFLIRTPHVGGLSLDKLLAVRIVLANGKVVVASAKRHSDLYWALRGGGAGNFGIVTELLFDASPLRTPVCLFEIVFDNTSSDATVAGFIDVYQRWAVASDSRMNPELDVTSSCNDNNALHVSVIGQFWGPLAEMLVVLQPLLAVAGARLVQAQRVPLIKAYGFVNKRFDVPALVNTQFAYNKNFWATAFLSVEMLTVLVTHMRQGSSFAGHHSLAFAAVGGPGSAFASVPEDATSFSPRSALLWVHFVTRFPLQRQEAENLVYARVFYSQVTRFLTPPLPTYIGFPDIDGDLATTYLQAYYGSHVARLQAVKQVYDPANVFCYTQGLVSCDTAPCTVLSTK